MKVKEVLKDIRFWIIIFFLIRLMGITNPPLETGHNWRQTTVAMVARNFLETDANILYPRIDIAGEKTGITGMEFPLLNYLIFLTAKIFGYQHWYGRLITLIVSSFGLWYFYKLLKKYFTVQVSFYSTIILTVSIWFQFSRKIMPDTFSMSFLIASIYYGTNYLESHKKRNPQDLILYSILMAIAVLTKLPSAYLLVVFGLFMFNKQISIKKKSVFVLISLLAITPAITWYFYWVPYLVEKYGFWHFFMGKGFAEGFKEILENMPQTISRFYDTALKFVGFAAFLLGVVFSIIKNEKQILAILLLTFFSFCVVIIKSGFTFPHHNYYIIPFVPIMALLAGYGLVQIKNPKVAIIILIAITIEGTTNQLPDFTIKEKYKNLVNLEEDLDKVSQPNDLIMINSNEYPTPMYFAHRKGWVETNDKIKQPDYIKGLASKGLKFIVILKTRFGSEINLKQYEKVLENNSYCIYKVGIREENS